MLTVKFYGTHAKEIGFSCAFNYQLGLVINKVLLIAV